MNAQRRSLLVVTALVLGVGWATQALQGWSSAQLGQSVAATARPGDIRMLSSETCEYCMRARAWFGRHRVPFSECTIERDAACAAEFSATLAPGTPVLLVRGAKLVGFDPRAVAEALAPRRPPQ